MTLSIGALVACGGASRSSPQEVKDANDTGRVVRAGTPTEQAVLDQLGRLPPGAPRAVGTGEVVAEPAYHAASGRTCRALRLKETRPPKVSQRLACHDGKAWFFVPDVLGLEQPAE